MNDRRKSIAAWLARTSVELCRRLTAEELDRADRFDQLGGDEEQERCAREARQWVDAAAVLAAFEAAGAPLAPRSGAGAETIGRLAQALPGSVFSGLNWRSLAPGDWDAIGAAARELAAVLAPADAIEDALIELFEASAALAIEWRPGGPRIARDDRGLKTRGVFYTPRAVAEQVLDAALGQPSGAAFPRVLDPAVGAGRFLLAAWRRARAWLARQSSAGRPSPSALAALARERLFGVDIDPRAVIFARSALYLAVHRALRECGARDPLSLLPDLRGAIVCGDPLVAPGAGDDLLEAHHRRDALDLAEAFPQVFGDDTSGSGDGRRRGFDIVVANPPYRFGEHLGARYRERSMRRAFRGAGPQLDTYGLFLERAITRWLRPAGRYAFLVPDAILAREQAAALRRLLVAEGAIESCWVIGGVFERVVSISEAIENDGGEEDKYDDEKGTTQVVEKEGEDEEEKARGRRRAAGKGKVGVSVVLIAGSRRPYSPERVLRAHSFGASADEANTVSHAAIMADPAHRFLIHLSPQDRWRLEELRSGGRTVADLLQPQRGIGRGEETGKKRLPDQPTAEQAIPVIAGEAVEPYRVGPARRYVAALRPSKRRLYESPKILVVKTGRRLIAARDDSGAACLQSVYCLRPRDETAAVLLETWLNSAACAWLVERTITGYKRLMPQVTQNELLALPVPPIADDAVARLSSLLRRIRRAGAACPEGRRLQEHIDALWRIVTPASAQTDAR